MALEQILPGGGELDQRQGPVGLLDAGDELEAEAVAHVLGDRFGRDGGAVGLGHRLEDQRQVADRDALLQQQAQHGLERVEGELVGDEFLVDALVRLGPARVGGS